MRRQFINSCSSQQIHFNSSISWQYLAWFSWQSLFLNSNSPHKLILYLCAWSAHRLAWCSWNRWDSNSWLISWKAMSEFLFSQFLASTSVPASYICCRAILSPRTAISAFRSKIFWRFSVSQRMRNVLISIPLFSFDCELKNKCVKKHSHIFVFRVENHVRQNYFANACLFLFLCCWSALPRDSCFDHGLWPVPCLDQCWTRASETWNRVPCFLFLCILRYLSVMLSSVHKSRSVVKLRWCPQNRSKSCPLGSPSGKMLRCSHHSLSSSLVLCSVSLKIAPSPLGKLCWEQVCVRELWAMRIRVSCALWGVQNPLFGPSAYSVKYETCVILSSAQSVKCETCLLVSPRSLWGANKCSIVPAYSGNSAISCPTHLMTCLHRVFVVCKKTFLLSVTLWWIWNVEFLLTFGGVRDTFLATEIRQKQHSTWSRLSITLSFVREVFCWAQLHWSCHTDSGTSCSPLHIKMPKDDDEFKLYPCFNGLPSESLDDCTFEVEALVAGSKDDEKKLLGPRLVCRLGGVPVALAKRESHMPDLAKPEGYKMILVFLKKSLQRRCSGQATSCESPVWGFCTTSWTDVGAFQLEMSVDQDLSVVAEAIDDDAVKQWLVPIVFTHASDTAT